jgi:hypothetical protein
VKAVETTPGSRGHSRLHECQRSELAAAGSVVEDRDEVDVALGLELAPTDRPLQVEPGDETRRRAVNLSQVEGRRLGHLIGQPHPAILSGSRTANALITAFRVAGHVLPFFAAFAPAKRADILRRC